MDNLLPPLPTLQHLYESKILTTTPDETKRIVQLALQHLKDNVSSSTSYTSLLKACGGKPATLGILGAILGRQSKDGRFVAICVCEAGWRTGDLNAGYQLARLLYSGATTKNKDTKRAQEIMANTADLGHTPSQIALGLRLINTKDDIKVGLAWLEKAAASGAIQASMHLVLSVGTLYAQDLDANHPKNLEKAIRHLKRAHENGLPEATFLLGTHYASGAASPNSAPDERTAMQHYLAAADKGLSIAQHNVGSYYFTGTETGMPRDILRAIEYWKMAAMGGLQLSQINLGKLYSEGLEGDLSNPTIKKDLGLAKSFLGQAVERGGPLGQEAKMILEALN
ncbi:hypothetical protein DFS34DRAFT_591981 [Phlyctochytrium arcticum]|nr:hypothetical protein DFS34DRAFT_591981 [Phlyctochytrium arcticum]